MTDVAAIPPPVMLCWPLPPRIPLEPGSRGAVEAKIFLGAGYSAPVHVCMIKSNWNEKSSAPPARSIPS
jgi:hypothetical protein